MQSCSFVLNQHTYNPFALDIIGKQTVLLPCLQFSPIDVSIATRLCILPCSFVYAASLDAELVKQALAETLDVFITLAGRYDVRGQGLIS